MTHPREAKTNNNKSSNLLVAVVITVITNAWFPCTKSIVTPKEEEEAKRKT